MKEKEKYKINKKNNNKFQEAQQFSTICIHFQPYPGFSSNLQPFTDIYSHLQQFTAIPVIYSHLQPFLPIPAMYRHLQPFKQFTASQAIFGNLQPFPVISSHCRQISRHFQPISAIFSKIFTNEVFLYYSNLWG